MQKKVLQYRNCSVLIKTWTKKPSCKIFLNNNNDMTTTNNSKYYCNKLYYCYY